ncbi:hypothetical protein D9757_008370 [Collybiopsis confluens]|uniref:Uncharacterized protein n=1 Tax=Collybiopsis confluens TaxID=2823264 RepID=A0A8H5HEN3_9AGAR|nr:hypothetical protein D9757_008370 [Collybiopsis confluens]
MNVPSRMCTLREIRRHLRVVIGTILVVVSLLFSITSIVVIPPKPCFYEDFNNQNMPPLSDDALFLINQAAAALISHVKSRENLILTDEHIIRSWAKEFALAVSKYRRIVRVLTQNRSNEVAFTPSAEVISTLVAADKFLLKNVHWSWDDLWLDQRWKNAAAERKMVWETEEERRRKARESEEHARIAKAEALLCMENIEIDYPTAEELEAYRRETGAVPDESQKTPPIHSFNPVFNSTDIDNDTLARFSPLTFQRQFSLPPQTILANTKRSRQAVDDDGDDDGESNENGSGDGQYEETKISKDAELIGAITSNSRQAYVHRHRVAFVKEKSASASALTIRSVALAVLKIILGVPWKRTSHQLRGAGAGAGGEGEALVGGGGGPPLEELGLEHRARRSD